jgi:alpha-glucosidase
MIEKLKNIELYLRLYKSFLIFSVCLLSFGGAIPHALGVATYKTIKSPDKKIVLELGIDSQAQAYYSVAVGGKQVLLPSRLGLTREDGDFLSGLQLLSFSAVKNIKDRYTLAHGKKTNTTYFAYQQTMHLSNASGQRMDIIVQVSDIGIAFRYFFPDTVQKVKQIIKEHTVFAFPAQAKAFLQPMSEPRTGWAEVNPCYEEYYQIGIPVGTPAPGKEGWVYPALFESEGSWLLLTEAALDRAYCATRLAAQAPKGVYTIDFPQPEEIFPGGALLPQHTLPWYSPWRVLTIGSLSTIVESTHGTDLADPDFSKGKIKPLPGKASWSWPILKDDSTTYDVQKKFIDYAAEMNWEYCLIDSGWDIKIGYEKIKELAAYAKSRNVILLLWYNSSGDWNSTILTPKNKLIDREERRREFAHLEEIGIGGVKIDFFAGDGTSMIEYYLDILEDAAQYNLLVNFHGATLPRGWHRTYPHLMTAEAVRGFEYITFGQEGADEEARHCTMLPFARNAFDPMDYTPLSLTEVPHFDRKTTAAFQMALTVLFTSGIQHYAEIPEGIAQAPQEIKTLLRQIPGTWKDVRFVAGYPGSYVVVARQSPDGRWYIAGINGEQEARNITLDLSWLGKKKPALLIQDGEERGKFNIKRTTSGQLSAQSIELKAAGGFIIQIEK